LIDHIKKQGYEDLMIVSPDAGGFERARAFAKRLGAMLGIIEKRREEKNVSHVINIIGEVEGKNIILLDDMIDTAGTIVNSADALIKNGAQSVRAYCTHPVFSGPAIARLENSRLEEIVVTDTIPLRPEALHCSKITVLTVAHLLGEAIRRIHSNDSVSSLFV
jgi:ribose-phosphate pyrophosphokinase